MNCNDRVGGDMLGHDLGWAAVKGGAGVALLLGLLWLAGALS